MSDREKTQEFLQDLSLAVPNLQDYRMFDWLILALWGYSVLWPLKNRAVALFLVSIVELLWGIYDLSIGEYAQSIPFFFYFLGTVVSYLRLNQESQQ